MGLLVPFLICLCYLCNAFAVSELTDGSHDDLDNSTNSMSSAKPTVVSVRMRSEAEIFGAKRAASRRKTADNDDDLKYLSQLHLVPWKPARFRTHKVRLRFKFSTYSPYMPSSIAQFSCVLWNMLQAIALNSPEIIGRHYFCHRSTRKPTSIFTAIIYAYFSIVVLSLYSNSPCEVLVTLVAIKGKAN